MLGSVNRNKKRKTVQVAFVCCRLQVRVPARTVWVQQTQVLQEGHLTPHDHVVTLRQHMDIKPFEMLDRLAGSPNEKPTENPTEIPTEKPTEKRSAWFRGFRFETEKKNENATGMFGENPKTDRAHFHCRFTTLAIPQTSLTHEVAHRPPALNKAPVLRR